MWFTSSTLRIVSCICEGLLLGDSGPREDHMWQSASAEQRKYPLLQSRCFSRVTQADLTKHSVDVTASSGGAQVDFAPCPQVA